jgi:hypothetical protein
MKKIDTLGQEANQATKVTLDDGSIVALAFRYLPTVQRWMMDVDHPDLTLRGATLCAHPNILRAWRNTCRFGIACVSTDGIDPIEAGAFSSGRVSVYILEKDEVRYVEQSIFGSAI